MFFLIYATVYEVKYTCFRVYEGQLVGSNKRAKARIPRPNFRPSRKLCASEIHGFSRKKRESQQNSWFVHDASGKSMATLASPQVCAT